MRHGLVRLLKLLEVQAKWYVMSDDPEIFRITKTKFHNILQDVNGRDVFLEDSDKKKFLEWSEENAKLLEKPLTGADVVVIDDPQPSGMTRHIKKLNPDAKIIYRSHIQLLADLADEEGTAQNKTWGFINENISGYDAFVAHPIPEFVPKDVNKDKLVYMGATTDPLDGLNKELSSGQMDNYMRKVNELLVATGQTPLEHTRAYITQIARFDPSKGITDVVELYAKLCEKLSSKRVLPQLVIAGNSSVDDPDGIPVYQQTIVLIENKYKHLKNDIKVIRLPHHDQLLNALLRNAHVCLQLSHKEGFEIKISEAIMKGVPVIVYKSGGMPLQVKDGINGFVVETGDTDAVAEKLISLFTDRQLYMSMSGHLINNVSRDVLTVKNVIAWLWLTNELVEREKLPKGGRYVHEMVG